MNINFEKVHENFEGKIENLCNKCGGQCENNETVIFFPNEMEFIAKKLGISPKKFSDKYCNKIKFKNKYVIMMKVGKCPFLSKSNNCRLEKYNCKLLKCKLYPIIIGKNKKGLPAVRINYEGCPMAKKLPDKFKEEAYGIAKHLMKSLPKYWIDFSVDYDEEKYDYVKLKKLRNMIIISIFKLKQCLIKNEY